jgi:O-antigen ligase
VRFVALALFLALIPVLHGWMTNNVAQRRWVWMVIGFLPFAIDWLHLDASIISWAMWPGYVKGMLVSLLDAIAVAVLFTLPGRRLKTPFLWLILAYALASALTVTFAQIKMAAFFYVWQLLRMLLVTAAVARIASTMDGVRSVMTGVMIGAIVQGCFSISERLHGVAQAGGTMGHQNSLGMAMHFAIYPTLALLLAGRRDKLTMLAFASSVIAVVLTGSRATIGLAGAGVVVLVLLSMIQRPSGRKTMIAALGGMLILAAAPLAYFTLAARLSSESIASSDEERSAFERAAWMMHADHPMGIGPNQYVVVANTQGYSARAGVNWNSGSRATNVHNTYLLMLSETGYIGIAAFAALMILPVLAAMRFARRKRRDPRSELALGLAVALGAVALHCMFEWIYVTYPIQYLHAITLGLLGGLIRQRQLEARDERLKRRQAAAAVEEEEVPAVSPAPGPVLA